MLFHFCDHNCKDGSRLCVADRARTGDSIHFYDSFSDKVSFLPVPSHRCRRGHFGLDLPRDTMAKSTQTAHRSEINIDLAIVHTDSSPLVAAGPSEVGPNGTMVVWSRWVRTSVSSVWGGFWKLARSPSNLAPLNRDMRRPSIRIGK